VETDRHSTSINVLTSLGLHLAKIPMYFDSDREAIEHALVSTGEPDSAGARVVRIADTLSLENLQVSEVYAGEWSRTTEVEPLGAAREMALDERGNLLPL